MLDIESFTSLARGQQQGRLLMMIMKGDDGDNYDNGHDGDGDDGDNDDDDDDGGYDDGDEGDIDRVIHGVL